MARRAQRRRVIRYAAGRVVARLDTLAAEEPLEIRIDGRPFAVTMRTPGDDVDLTIGFLLSEGLIADAADVSTARFCAGSEYGTNSYNVLDVTLAAGVAAPRANRASYVSSSCGVCGKASIDAVGTASRYSLAQDATPVDPAVLVTLPDRLRQHQQIFDRTGGLHAAGLFTAAGEMLCVREDVGRHNAVDKVVGWAARENRLPLRATVLQVSGRASFELVQKAVMAGIPVLSAVSAPSSLAVELAEQGQLTLAGFVRDTSFTVYAGGSRLGMADDDSALVVDTTGTP